MSRRIAIVLTGLVLAGSLATGTASAAPTNDPHHLTAKEKSGLRFAGDVLGSLFGGAGTTLGRGF
ncbi:hypothetical protein [Streptomyces sp. NBC_01012]|uniref:hypothetical protein n=1 Tax=Streptomyces sp. NBC_01012 TaxID=2903717 RepID=UPI00386D9A22|nr:hypothetical protein OG623_33940 [Streptomyces sp. NBC_01012]